MQDSSKGCHRLLQSQLVTPVCTRWCVKQTSIFGTYMVAARPQLLASDPLSLCHLSPKLSRPSFAGIISA